MSDFLIPAQPGFFLVTKGGDLPIIAWRAEVTPDYVFTLPVVMGMADTHGPFVVRSPEGPLLEFTGTLAGLVRGD